MDARFKRDYPTTPNAELAARYGVDEVMVHPVAAAHVGTDPDRSPRTLTCYVVCLPV